MKPFLLIIGLLHLLDVVAQPSFEPMQNRESRYRTSLVKSGVKKETMFVYPVNKKGKIAEKGELRSIVEFDSLGHTVYECSFFPNGSLCNRMEYNALGKLAKLTQLNSSGQILQIFKSDYDSSGVLLRTNYYDNNEKLVHVTEGAVKKKQGKLSISYDSEGNVSSKDEITYDSTNNIYTARLLSPTDELMYENRYELNEFHQIIKWQITDNYQNRYTITTFIYDKNGNKIEEHETDLKGNPTQKTINKYNEAALTTESIWFKPADKMIQVAKYTYEYF